MLAPLILNVFMTVWLPIAVFFLAATVFRTSSFFHLPPRIISSDLVPGPAVLVAPFLKPANGVGDTPPLPYYLYAVLFFCIDARYSSPRYHLR